MAILINDKDITVESVWHKSVNSIVLCATIVACLRLVIKTVLTDKGCIDIEID
jgi:hypothetical protein